MSTRSPDPIGSSAKNIGSDLRELAEPATRDEKVRSIIDRAARRAGLSYWRAYNIWFGKARRIEPEEREAIKAALDNKRRDAARNELHELRLRLARLESLLVQTDAEFHRDTIDQIGRQGGGFGRGRGPVAAKA